LAGGKLLAVRRNKFNDAASGAARLMHAAC
jgi:hypothetical protein